MKNRSFVLLLALAGCGDDRSWIGAANAATPSSSASSSVSVPASTVASSAAPAPSGSASASGPATPPPPKKLYENPPSDEKTKAPSAAEWAKAEEVQPFRSTDHRCKTKQIREWLQVFCPSWPFGTSLVTGNREGVTFREVSESEPSGSYVTFPVRRGDRRVFLMFAQTKWSGNPSTHISVQWLEGDAGPIVGIY